MHNRNHSDEEKYLLTNYQLDCARAWGMTFSVPSTPLLFQQYAARKDRGLKGKEIFVPRAHSSSIRPWQFNMAENMSSN